MTPRTPPLPFMAPDDDLPPTAIVISARVKVVRRRWKKARTISFEEYGLCACGQSNRFDGNLTNCSVCGRCHYKLRPEQIEAIERVSGRRFEKNLAMINTAMKMVGISSGNDTEEYFSLGVEIICEAAGRYDPSRGRFSTIAMTWLKGKFRHMLRKKKREEALSLNEQITDDASQAGGYEDIEAKDFIQALGKYVGKPVIKRILNGTVTRADRKELRQHPEVMRLVAEMMGQV